MSLLCRPIVYILVCVLEIEQLMLCLYGLFHEDVIRGFGHYVGQLSFHRRLLWCIWKPARKSEKLSQLSNENGLVAPSRQTANRTSHHFFALSSKYLHLDQRRSRTISPTSPRERRDARTISPASPPANPKEQRPPIQIRISSVWMNFSSRAFQTKEIMNYLGTRTSLVKKIARDSAN